MATLAGATLDNRSSLLRSSLIGGLLIALLHTIVQDWLIFVYLYKAPFLTTMQYIASGLIGTASFAGGLTTALFGLILHILMCIIIAGIFVFSAARIPLLRRHLIPGSLLYGFGVFIVMGFIVVPLSAAPPLPTPPTTFQILEGLVEHMLLIGLPLGLLLQRGPGG